MWYCGTPEPVERWVPQPVGLGNQAPTMDAVPRSVFSRLLCTFALNCLFIRVDWRQFADGSLFSRLTLTCRPAGALRYLPVCPCYKHFAPLGLNTSPLLPRRE